MPTEPCSDAAGKCVLSNHPWRKVPLWRFKEYSFPVHLHVRLWWNKRCCITYFSLLCRSLLTILFHLKSWISIYFLFFFYMCSSENYLEPGLCIIGELFHYSQLKELQFCFFKNHGLVFVELSWNLIFFKRIYYYSNCVLIFSFLDHNFNIYTVFNLHILFSEFITYM